MKNLALKTKSYIASAAEVLNVEIQGLSDLAASLDSNFDKSIDLILNTKGRIIISGIGKSGHIARKIAATLSSTGTPALFVHASEASHGDLGMITEQDTVILISNSGESPELVNIIDYCKRFGINIIGIARNPKSTLIKASCVAIVLPETPEASDIPAPTTSTTQTLALGDAMAVVLHQARGFTKSEFKVYHPGGKLGAQLLKVSELMHAGQGVPLVESGSKVIEAIYEMSAKRLGCVGVIDKKGQLLGIFTDGDLRRHIDCDVKMTVIDEVMTTNSKTIGKDAFASEALCIMNAKSITSLFVLDGSEPVGVIHMHDILRAKVA